MLYLKFLYLYFRVVFFFFYFTTLKFVLQAPVGVISSDFSAIFFVHFYRFFMNILFKIQGRLFNIYMVFYRQHRRISRCRESVHTLSRGQDSCPIRGRLHVIGSPRFFLQKKSPPGRILSYFSAKTGSLTGSGCIFEYWCEFHLDEKETLL